MDRSFPDCDKCTGRRLLPQSAEHLNGCGNHVSQGQRGDGKSRLEPSEQSSAAAFILRDGRWSSPLTAGVERKRLRLITPTDHRENSIVLNFIAISLGAIVGANARYLISRYAAKLLGPVFPYGTLIINVSGSFVVGVFLIWTTGRVLIDPRWRLLVVIGFCGGFTTFSSYAFETMAYFEQGQWLLMTANIAANNLLSLAAAIAGMAVARVL